MTQTRQAGLSYSGKEIKLFQSFQLKKKLQSTGKSIQVFLHIPKCAGSSVDRMMAACAHYRQRNYMRYVVEEFKPPVLIRPGWIGAWSDVVSRANLSGRKGQYVSGHFPFGVHKLFDKRCRYITVLRNPIERELSSFNFHYQRGYLDENACLENLMEKKEILDNPQTRMLAGIESMHGECSDEIYWSAISNLDAHFDLVGIAEKTDAFMSALLGLNGWPAVLSARAQVTGVRLIDTPSGDLTQQLRTFHAYDVQLYERAVKYWLRWTEMNIKGNKPLKPNHDVLYIPPDFQKSGQLKLLKASQLGNDFGWAQ